MAPVLSILFRQLWRRPSVQGPPAWKAPRLQAGVGPEVLCPPSRPQDSRVEYGEGGPPAQVTWDLNKWSRTNRPTPVHTTWPGMQKGAPWTGHQKRGNRVALLCKRAQFAPKPGGNPLARSEDAAFILKTIVAPKIDLENASAVRKVVQDCVGTKFVAKGGNLAYDIATDAVKTVALTSGDKKEVDIMRYAKVEKSPSGMMEDSIVLKCIMFNKVVNHPKTKRRTEHPRILLLDCNLEYKKG